MLLAKNAPRYSTTDLDRKFDMNTTIREIDEGSLQDANKCDAAFTVDSKLALHMKDGVIRYSVVSVAPYRKQYIFEAKEYSTYISNPDKIVYFAYADGQLAGQITLSKHWNAYAWIDDFAVDARFRRRGVGRALMQKAVDWAKEKNLPGIMLETQDVNVPACRFYENFGFKLRGFDTHLYKGLTPDTDEIALYWYLMS
jgi:ribosomal protein S18 acetylase RimI-like enzyme